MIKLALGLIETVGLAAAIEAADTALKTANVELVGYELSKGYGLVTLKIQGDVSSVNAAIKSASISAEKVNKVFSTTIIARPHEELESVVITDETVGIEKSDYSNGKENQQEQNHCEDIDDNKEFLENKDINEEENILQKEKELEKDENTLSDNSSNEEGTKQSLISEESKKKSIEELSDSKDKENNVDVEGRKLTCNLCMDPKCPRKKGDARNMCIHYKIK